MPNTTFTPNALIQYIEIQAFDKRTLKKLNELLKEISRNPKGGTGQVERLKWQNGEVYSRRLNKKDRIIYSVDKDGTSTILQIGEHYEDK